MPEQRANNKSIDEEEIVIVSENLTSRVKSQVNAPDYKKIGFTEGAELD